MGLKCSIFGHAYKPAGAERERESRGDEVVTVVREVERCRRCGAERVVAENTEVTTTDEGGQAGRGPAGGGAGGPGGPGGGGAGVGGPGSTDRPASDQGGAVDPSAGSDSGLDDRSHEPINTDFDHADPAEDDAEILDDDEPERQPGEWPDDADTTAGRTESSAADRGRDAPAGSDAGTDEDDPVSGQPDYGGEYDSDLDPDPESGSGAGDESLSGITVPDGRIVCPECSFAVEAQSGYRSGDPCPECGAWLVTEDDA